ncbi:TM2 domain-containing protein [Corynebacterium nasicanis]|uniref:TM2 domain-containing protein n=1 Tax=Corynebacterium nasicanis TaxID=1448267 RepID=A0ABW1QB77_9CORY
MTNPFNQQQYDQNGMPIAQPMYAQPQYGMMQPQAPAKSWVVAILLAFFLGSLGVHNFYLGYTNRGVVQLVLTIFGWATTVLLIGFIFLAIVWVWVLIDFILILLRSGGMATDANGVPLS